MKWPEKIVVSAGKNIMGETLLGVEMGAEFAGPDERIYILAPQPKRRQAGRKPARRGGAK